MGAERHDELAARGRDADVQGAAVGERLRRDLDDPGLSFPHDVERAVGRAGVDDDDLEAWCAALRIDAIEGFPDRTGLVLRADDDGGGHWRLSIGLRT